MRLAVLGAGALGILEGALLTQAGYDCTLIATNKDKLNALNRYGARLSGFYQATIPVKALAPADAAGVFDYVLLLTKQTTMLEALDGIASCIGPDTAVVTLQNGIPEDAVAAKIGRSRVIAGSVFHGAYYLGEGQSRLTTQFDKKHIYLGELDGSLTPRIMRLREILSSAGGVTVSRDIMAVKYSKLVMNTAISGVSAALGCSFGVAGDDPQALRCMTRLSCEGALVLQAKGIKPVDMAGYLPSVENFSLKSEAALLKGDEQMRRLVSFSYDEVASMLQDIRSGKSQCEIDQINGKIVAEGKKLGLDTPFNQAVVTVIIAIQNRQLQPSWDNLRFFPL